ncbi:MAG: hypothetical protein J6L99_00780 [Ruminococcus sp.]|nr:hypothetical protein [Ruminococcus sp.]
MKVDITDVLWAIVSLFIVGNSYLNGKLLYGLVGIYGLMFLLFMYHIFMVKKRIQGSVAVYGMITGYYHEPQGLKGIYPVVTYTTEEGRKITAQYTVSDHKERYELHSEEMICYDPTNPTFFYFANREDDLTRDYFRYIIIGGVIAAILFLIAQMHG